MPCLGLYTQANQKVADGPSYLLQHMSLCVQLLHRPFGTLFRHTCARH